MYSGHAFRVCEPLYIFGKWQDLAVSHAIKTTESATVVEKQGNVEGEVVHGKVTRYSRKVVALTAITHGVRRRNTG
jgi:hypothetical protein